MYNEPNIEALIKSRQIECVGHVVKVSEIAMNVVPDGRAGKKDGCNIGSPVEGANMGELVTADRRQEGVEALVISSHSENLQY